jgi:hypothetical protein
MGKPSNIPDWLLNQLFLKHGVFNADRTAVISGHKSDGDGENPDSEPEGTFSIDLTRRPDWETIRKKLADEGF